jgi:hypothetical protein
LGRRQIALNGTVPLGSKSSVCLAPVRFSGKGCFGDLATSLQARNVCAGGMNVCLSAPKLCSKRMNGVPERHSGQGAVGNLCVAVPDQPLNGIQLFPQRGHLCSGSR